MKIKRTLATHIMSRAMARYDQCMTGLIGPEGALEFSSDVEHINRVLQETPESILVYNQSQESARIRNQIRHYDGQRCIEVFQDTRGVFGLRAYQQKAKIQTPVKLELDDNEE